MLNITCHVWAVIQRHAKGLFVMDRAQQFGVHVNTAPRCRNHVHVSTDGTVNCMLQQTLASSNLDLAGIELLQWNSQHLLHGSCTAKLHNQA